MALFVWENLYSVGFHEIDMQHERLFDLANEYHDAYTGNAGHSVLQPVFAGLLDYTKYHFAEEEKIMERCKFPDLARHKVHHEKLIGGVMNYQKQFEAGVKGIETACMDFIKLWLNAHILGTDKQYMPYVTGDGGAAHAV